MARLQGDTDTACTLSGQAVASLRQRPGPDHLLTMTCMANLASDHAARGEHTVARELGARVLDRWRDLLGPRHPATLASALNRSEDLICDGQSERGARLYQAAFAEYARVLAKRIRRCHRRERGSA